MLTVTPVTWQLPAVSREDIAKGEFAPRSYEKSFHTLSGTTCHPAPKTSTTALQDAKRGSPEGLPAMLIPDYIIG